MFPGRNVVAINKFTRHTPEIFHSFHGVAINFRNISNSVFFLQKITSCALQRVTPRHTQSRGHSLLVEALDSLVAQRLTLPRMALVPAAMPSCQVSRKTLALRVETRNHGWQRAREKNNVSTNVATAQVCFTMHSPTPSRSLVTRGIDMCSVTAMTHCGSFFPETRQVLLIAQFVSSHSLSVAGSILCEHSLPPQGRIVQASKGRSGGQATRSGACPTLRDRPDTV